MQKIRPDLDIGTNIQDLRKNCNLTQDQTVAKLNLVGIPISKSTYAKIETNRMNIKVSELYALKTIFNVDFNAFFHNLDTDFRVLTEENFLNEEIKTQQDE